MDFSTLAHVLAALLVIVGIVGIFLPLLPGLPLVFAGLLVSAWADGFAHVHWGWLIVFALITLFSSLLDFWANAAGAKRQGASRLAVAGTLLGTFIGLFFGLPGVLLGPFIGAVAGELLHRRRFSAEEISRAGQVGLGSWLGLVLGTVLKLALAFAMLASFALIWWL